MIAALSVVGSCCDIEARRRMNIGFQQAVGRDFSDTEWALFCSKARQRKMDPVFHTYAEITNMAVPLPSRQALPIDRDPETEKLQRAYSQVMNVVPRKATRANKPTSSLEYGTCGSCRAGEHEITSGVSKACKCPCHQNVRETK